MFLFKKAVIALSINIALVSSALACTTLLAGVKQLMMAL